MKHFDKIKEIKEALDTSHVHFASHGEGYCYLNDNNYEYGKGAMSYPVSVGHVLQVGIHPMDVKRLGLSFN